MSTTIAQTMLLAVTAAYQGALSGRLVQFDGRRYEPHDINLLSNELTKWQRIVAQEQAAAAGNASAARFTMATFHDG